MKSTIRVRAFGRWSEFLGQSVDFRRGLQAERPQEKRYCRRVDAADLRLRAKRWQSTLFTFTGHGNSPQWDFGSVDQLEHEPDGAELRWINS